MLGSRIRPCLPLQDYEYNDAAANGGEEEEEDEEQQEEEFADAQSRGETRACSQASSFAGPQGTDWHRSIWSYGAAS